MNTVFHEKYDNFLKEFGKGKTMVLSSSENNRVTSRMMSVVQANGLFYFQTDKTFRKYNQLIVNPQVALCINNIQIEGICHEIGHPTKNDVFSGLYQEIFNSSFKRYTALENERLFVMKPTYIERWLYIDGVPYLEIFEIENKKYELVEYKGE